MKYAGMRGRPFAIAACAITVVSMFVLTTTASADETPLNRLINGSTQHTGRCVTGCPFLWMQVQVWDAGLGTWANYDHDGIGGNGPTLIGNACPTAATVTITWAAAGMYRVQFACHSSNTSAPGSGWAPNAQISVLAATPTINLTGTYGVDHVYENPQNAHIFANGGVTPAPNTIAYARLVLDYRWNEDNGVTWAVPQVVTTLTPGTGGWAATGAFVNIEQISNVTGGTLPGAVLELRGRYNANGWIVAPAGGDWVMNN